MDEFCREGQFIRIPGLELDLGTISLHNFEHHMEARLKEELRRALRKAKAEAEQYPRVNNTSFSETEHSMELLTYYLLNGTLPWWAKREKNFSIENLFLELLKKNKNRLLGWLKKKGHSHTLRARIVKQFKESTILTLVGELAPSEVTFIEAYVKDIKKTHQKKPVTKTSTQRLEEALWEVVLSYLLQDRGTRFNRKEFLRWNVSKLAIKYKVTYRELLNKLQQSITAVEKKHHYNSEIQSLLREIADEDLPVASPAREKEKKVSRRLLLFIAFLKTGEFSPNENFRSVHDLWKSLISEEPKMGLKAVLLYGKKEKVRSHITAAFSEQELAELVVLLEPSHADFILSYVENATEIHQQKKLKTGEESGFRESVWDFILKYLIEEKGTRFNKKEFIRVNLQHLAIQYRVTFEEVLAYFMEFIKKTKGKAEASASLPELVYELYREIPEEGQVSANDQLASALITRFDRFSELKKHLLYGVTSLKRPERRALYKELFERPKIHAGHFFRETLTSPESIYRLSSDMTRPLFKAFLSLFLAADYPSIHKFWEQLKIRVKPTQKFTIREERVFYEAVLQVVFSTRKISQQAVMQVIAEVALVHFSIERKSVFQLVGLGTANKTASVLQERKSISQLVEQVRGLRVNGAGKISSASRELELISVSRSAKSDKSTIIRSLEKESVIQLLHFYAEGKGKKSSLFIQGKKISFEEMMTLLFKHHYTISKDFFEKASSTLSHVVQAPLNTFYEQALSIVRKKSGQIAHAARLEEIIAGNIEKEADKQKKPEQEKPGKRRFSVEEVIKYLEGKSPVFPLESESEFIEALAYVYQHKKRVIENYLRFQSRSEAHIRDWISRLSERALIRILHIIDSHELRQRIRLTEEVLEVWQNMGAVSVIPKELNTLKWVILYKSGGYKMRRQRQAFFIRRVLESLFQNRDNSMAGELAQRHKLLQLLLSNSYIKSDKELLRVISDMAKQAKREKDDLEIFERQIPAKEQEETTEKEEEKPAFPEEEEPVTNLFVNNAGIVILGAFLPTYFSRLELLDGKEFKNQEAIYKAIHLLQYLVTGETENFEYDLSLHKIICGIEVSEPIPYNVELTPKELEISESLIEGAIEQWAVIGDTSVNGFRESFLKREGKLEDDDEYWKLTVEVKGYDMLLDQLPWSISMLMHSWMQKRIQIEWR